MMKYVITKEQSDRLERLQKMALKRHANKEPKGFKGGTFDVDGNVITYDFYTRPDGSLYAQATLKDRKHHIFIMNELDFLPLEKEEQQKISEYRIKKFLEKRNFLFESDSLRWFKRRATKDYLKSFIHKAEIEFPTLCDDFGDEFEYASGVIRWAVDDFMTIDEDLFLDDRYDEFSNTLTDMCKDWFGEYLMEIYRNTCTEDEEY